MTFDKEKSLWIPGPMGKLEALLESPRQESEVKSMALICHPHPLHRGNMHNKVVTTLSRAFQETGAYVIRFNYRGVLGSAGHYGDFIGEVEDALSVLKWIKKEFSDYQIAVGGFSFGAAVAIQIARQASIEQLITIAPALYLIDYPLDLNFHIPWLLVAAWADEVVNTQEILHWTGKLPIKPELCCLPEASHFFHGKLVYLRKKLIHYLGHLYDESH